MWLKKSYESQDSGVQSDCHEDLGPRRKEVTHIWTSSHYKASGSFQEPKLNSFDEELEELPLENIFKKCRKSISHVSLNTPSDDILDKKFDNSKRRKSDFGFVVSLTETPENSWKTKVVIIIPFFVFEQILFRSILWLFSKILLFLKLRFSPNFFRIIQRRLLPTLKTFSPLGPTTLWSALSKVLIGEYYNPLSSTRGTHLNFAQC